MIRLRPVAFRAIQLLLVCVCLAGCGVIPGYRERYEAARGAQQAAIEGADDAKCQSYRASLGSNAYVACRMNLSNSREAADEAQRQAWAGVAQTGANMMAQRPVPPSPPVSTDDHVCVAQNNALYRC